ncbi:hypothetical protein Q8F55_000923 [Vanrija albida]|uniref:Glycoside hydrolase family 71 protein n=1 Tax=Vanrija albida TaxID=181172 RepID=A0ABR3QEP5_9TREE
MKATFVLATLLALGATSASPVERRRLAPRLTVGPEGVSDVVSSTASASDSVSASISASVNATVSASVNATGSATSDASTSAWSSPGSTLSAVTPPKCRPRATSSSSPSGPTTSPGAATSPSGYASVSHSSVPSSAGSSASDASSVAPSSGSGSAALSSASDSGSAVPSTTVSASDSASGSGSIVPTMLSSVSDSGSASGSIAPTTLSSASDSASGSILPTTTLTPSSVDGNASRPDATGAPVPGGSDKLVFAHFMVGITYKYQAADWERDIRAAQSYGIDAFALNIGVDTLNHDQLTKAYDAAQALGFKVFLSFDFNWWKNDQVGEVVSYIKEWAAKPAQLKVKANDAAFVSTFIGAGFDWASVKQQVGFPLHVVPGNLRPDDAGTQSQVASGALDGLFSWHAWPGQENNTPVAAPLTTDTDKAYQALVAKSGKDYMAPVSPWFFTHLTQYNKNFLFKSEQLWHYRWQQILDLAPDYVEIVTWNDYGESHHVAGYGDWVDDDGSEMYARGLDHTKLMDLAVPFIKAYKAGGKAPVVEKDFAVYWHRPHLKSAECDASDPVKGSSNTNVQPGGVPAGKPAGWDLVADVVFVAVASKNGGKVTVTSGSNAPVTHEAAAGIQVFEVPVGTGQQKIELVSDAGSASGTSEVPITAGCWQDKLYNFNFHAGIVSAA